MLPVGFEPTVSAGERPQTYALHRAANGTGSFFRYSQNKELYLVALFGTSKPQTLDIGFFHSFLHTCIHPHMPSCNLPFIPPCPPFPFFPSDPTFHKILFSFIHPIFFFPLVSLLLSLLLPIYRFLLCTRNFFFH